MGRINSRLLFLTTSPRTPEKMIPEIETLIRHFEGRKWNTETQSAFMQVLRKELFFHGNGEKDPAFSARDRINRSPKALGFVSLSPVISLTPAGRLLLRTKHKQEIFLRQMLKFQLPSPYHQPTDAAAAFCVKPYLEILRLIRTMGCLKFDELQIFGMQLTDWHAFDEVVHKIETFRIAKTENKGSYRVFKTKYLYKELIDIYAGRIAKGETKTRESDDASLKKFLKTQSNNTRDYADACFRYLRATGLVNVSYIGKSLSIVPEFVSDVDYILNTVDRNPCFVNDEAAYLSYLGSAELPRLMTDDRDILMERLRVNFAKTNLPQGTTTRELKELLYECTETGKNEAIKQQVQTIKAYKSYDDIQNTFAQILKGDLYDIPLMFEWNVWRAMTMLDGGEVKANLNFDDFGNPVSVAQGNMADIICDYGDYILIVEVTMSKGQRQYDMEGEPVGRHLGRMKKTSGKPCYCLFVAPEINEACVAHFYTLHNVNISYYGGKSAIVPLPLSLLQKMLEDSYKADYTPDPEHIRTFFTHSEELAKVCENEKQWFEQVKKSAIDWLHL